MRYYLFSVFIGTSILFIISCKKEKNEQVVINSDFLIGNWELRQLQAGMSPSTTYAPGNGNIYTFSAIGYQMYSNGQLTKTGTYSIIKNPSNLNNECLDSSLNRIIFDNNLLQSKRIEVSSNNTITFISGCPALDSGVYMVYER